MKTLFLSLVGLIVALLAGHRSPAQLLQQRLYGPIVSVATTMQPARAGGYYAAATTYQSGNFYRGWLLRLNDQGDTLWTRRYRMPGFSGDVLFGGELCENSAGQLLLSIIGHRTPNRTDYEGALMLLNSQGDTLWTIGRVAPTIGGYGSIILGNDGNFIVAALVNNQPLVMKLSANGQVLFQTPLNYSPISIGGPGILFSDNSILGGYWVVLYDDLIGSSSRKLVHLTENGVKDREIVYPVPNALFYNIVPLPNRAGYLASVDGKIVRFNTAFDTLWTRYCLYRNTIPVDAYNIKLLADGNAVVAGLYYDPAGGRVYLGKVSPDGRVLRDTVLNTPYGNQYVRNLAIEPNTGNYVFSGITTATPQSNSPALFFGIQRRWSITTGTRQAWQLPPLALGAWPNPLGEQHTLHIQCPQQLQGPLVLRDALGRTVRQWPATAALARPEGQDIEVGALPSGLYLLTATGLDGRRYLARVVRE